ncbi:hypothetical protein [Clostridium beijerinckii]
MNINKIAVQYFFLSYFKRLPSKSAFLIIYPLNSTICTDFSVIWFSRE